MGEPKPVRALKRKIRTANRDGYGILNPYGDMWTTEIFETPAAAEQFVRDFWRGAKDIDHSRFRVVRARVRTSFVGPLSDKERDG
jgi:hypothetical protein